MSLESRIDGIEARIHADNGPIPGSTVPTFTRPTLNLDRQQLALALPRQQLMPRNETENKLRDIMKTSGIIKINGTDYQTHMKDLRELEELGDGTSGHVVKMHHIPSGAVIAVKQMRRTGNAEENKRIVNDIETALKAHGCPYIVQCLGFIITSADVWICMELMATCFDKLLKRTSKPVPEDILGKVTVAVVKALSFLKDKGTMHRDVKPSNILVDERGVIKLCDFGISGQLNNSKAKTRSAGCVAYLAPERIDPNRSEYDIRADVWSLGITLVELATGKFPYQDCRTDFEVLTRVMQSAPPTLPADQGFSLEFQNFVKRCLIHDVNSRPKYKDLLQLPFFMLYEAKPVNVADWLKGAMKLAGLPSHKRDQLLQNHETDNEQEMEMCCPMPPLVKSPEVSIYASNQQHASHIPERPHPFLIANKSPFISPPEKQQPQKQYCNFRESPFEGHAAGSFKSNQMSSYDHQPAAGATPETSKVYRKSPFLPRKKNSPENGVAPKKESKLSTLGSSLLKNLTTSPFLQRKQTQAPAPQSAVPQIPIETPQRSKFPSQHQHQHRPLEMSGNSQLPRPTFHQYSPLLQRRNPSYVTYGECNASPNKGRSSANTSPIVLQRFFHQQNQHREKLNDERQQQHQIMTTTTTMTTEGYSYDHPDNASNPFLGSNYSPLARQKYQTIRSRGPFEHPADNGFHGEDNSVTIGSSRNMCESNMHNLGSNGSSETTTTTTTTNFLTATKMTTTHQRLNLGMTTAMPQQQNEEKLTMRSEGFATHEASIGENEAGGGEDSAAGGTYEKNLGWFNSFAGDVKRRFASYLKVNLSEERRLRNEEHEKATTAATTAATSVPQFAPTNPFLDPSDICLAPPPQISSRESLGDKFKLDRRHRSPDPPPRYNRQSPLVLRKKLEMSNWGGSPHLSRRFITGSPPIQLTEPRRDCESVPGSPQHFRTRIHYTPEPQRRFYRP